MESPIVIEHRDALVYMLSEAAELEHAICCQYLFAGFSMKTDPAEGLTERQVADVTRWKRLILQIGAEEMLHLALVNNLLAAIGAAPRVGRPNFPQRGRYYPPGVQLALVPFGETALRHFLYLERPEGITLRDADGFEIQDEAEPLMSSEDIVPRPQDFATVGHLYRAIEDGFRTLAARHGEDWLFIGPERAQATSRSFGWPELNPVTDLASAVQAIGTIVEQGEGPRGHWRDAHYGRLLIVLGEYLTEKKAHPGFEPARPVVAAGVRHTLDAEPGPLVSDRTTAKVLDAFNVSYEVLLYVLGRFFGHGVETDEQIDALADVAVGLMIDVIRPLGELSTTLPVGPEYPGATAGPSFELFYRSGYMLPHSRSSWVVIHERLMELRSFLLWVGGEPRLEDKLMPVAAALANLAQTLEAEMPDLKDREVPAPAAWLRPEEPTAT